MYNFFRYSKQAYSNMAANMNIIQPINHTSLDFSPEALGDVSLKMKVGKVEMKDGIKSENFSKVEHTVRFGRY